MIKTELTESIEAKEQLTTFYIGGELFGIDVMKVQEVTGRPNVVKVPLAPSFVRGLVNLRGQIATAIGLKELFMCQDESPENQMSVVCRIEGSLISLVVDSIGDVVEVEREYFEPTPDTVSNSIRQYVSGIYKLNGKLLSVIDVETIFKEISPNN